MKINGNEVPYTPGLTVLSLIVARGHDPQRVAVERNGEIVPRARFAETALTDADKIEIVAFVGGG